MKPNLVEALQQLERGKRMNRETVRQIVESALLSAARKSLGVTPERVEVEYDKAGEMSVVVRKTIVSGRTTSPDEISLSAAKKIKSGVAVGEEVTVEVPLDDLGRIAAQTAKHIVLQRVREEERAGLYGEFKDKVGKAITCMVKQRRGKLVILDLGDVEAILPGSEQIPKEDYRPGEHLKVFVAEVNNTPRGPHIIASRNRPELVRYLFEQEVPEVTQGIVSVKEVAREPGSRSKVAVHSLDRNVDPVGACIGMKGMRVQAVVQELHGEKMDVVSWDEDPETFLINALSPAKPARVIRNDETKTMIAVAADHNQLVHLIGRGGQNARLASKLTGWKVEVVTEIDLRGGAETATEGETAASAGEGQTSETATSAPATAADSPPTDTLGTDASQDPADHLKADASPDPAGHLKADASPDPADHLEAGPSPDPAGHLKADASPDPAGHLEAGPSPDPAAGEDN